MPTIDLVYFNAGGGHRAAALALEASLAEQRPHWQVRLVNLTDVLDPQDLFRRLTGIGPEDIYNKRLARGWTLGLAQELKLLQGVIRLGHAQLVKRLASHWARSEPDLVVSLIPNFNRALHEGLATACPGVPYVTVLTDLADHPPNFWIETGQRQHFICGTPRAVSQALAAGHAPACVHATSGMILRPGFYRQPAIDRAAERAGWRLDADRPTGLVLFGGHGSKAMDGIARQLHDVQLILLCGHNQALERRLRALPASAPRVVLGFTSEIPYWMRLADFFIGKPGPGSVSEAVQQRLPVIVTCNAWTMPQERYNAQWIREHGAGVVLPSFRGVRAAVQRVADGLESYRERLAKIDNRAVFEIPAILDGIWQRESAAIDARA
ncbi:glycosyltransferase [Caldimonas sp. KR1-144]|uniref:glycosyltransferase n=1 Tax=Caldimonas sp. KR1-144 TaxID=3400911 RepID=UPI003C103D46